MSIVPTGGAFEVSIYQVWYKYIHLFIQTVMTTNSLSVYIARLLALKNVYVHEYNVCGF